MRLRRPSLRGDRDTYHPGVSNDAERTTRLGASPLGRIDGVVTELLDIGSQLRRSVVEVEPLHDGLVFGRCQPGHPAFGEQFGALDGDVGLPLVVAI